MKLNMRLGISLLLGLGLASQSANCFFYNPVMYGIGGFASSYLGAFFSTKNNPAVLPYIALVCVGTHACSQSSWVPVASVTVSAIIGHISAGN